MSTFEVTPADLQGLAGRLAGLLGELEQALSGVRMDAAGVAQNPRLENAIAGFIGDWSGGLHDLQTKLSELAQRLDAAGAAYEGTEDGLADGFKPV